MSWRRSHRVSIDLYEEGDKGEAITDSAISAAFDACVQVSRSLSEGPKAIVETFRIIFSSFGEAFDRPGPVISIYFRDTFGNPSSREIGFNLIRGKNPNPSKEVLVQALECAITQELKNIHRMNPERLAAAQREVDAVDRYF